MRIVPRSRAAFSLLEMLIAVGAVTLIALGLSKVFSATGETVRFGRRVSNLNEYASLLERQFRTDIASMSREGFLLIKNRVAVDSAGFPLLVQINSEQPVAFARNRRVDELMFFASGRFTTLRESVHPARIASGTAARIYFGHGVQYPGGLSAAPSAFDVPGLDDGQIAGSLPPPLGEAGVNQYAVDWCLLRHVAVLSNQLATDRDPFPPTISGLTVQETPDNDLQVALQPAASSIFSNQARQTPQVHPGDARLARDGEAAVYPAMSSGLIDLCTTDLQEIRQVILDGQPYGTTLFDANADMTADGVLLYAYQSDNMPNNLMGTTSNMKSWMIGALPGNVWNNTNPLAPNPDSRMRFEFAPPDLLGVVDGGGTPWPANQTWRRVDQMMLSASNFVPHCTEFIVEWSFGKVMPPTGNNPGQLIWHGLERTADITGDGSTDIVASPYGIQNPAEELYLQRIERRDGSILLRDVPFELPHFPPQPAALPPGRALYSCFGYLDPTYAQSAYPNTASIPWAWPKLLRITISLVDPTEPLVEQSFQFVIELPDAKSERY